MEQNRRIFSVKSKIVIHSVLLFFWQMITFLMPIIFLFCMGSGLHIFPVVPVFAPYSLIFSFIGMTYGSFLYAFFVGYKRAEFLTQNMAKIVGLAILYNASFVFIIVFFRLALASNLHRILLVLGCFLLVSFAYYFTVTFCVKWGIKKGLEENLET